MRTVMYFHRDGGESSLTYDGLEGASDDGPTGGTGVSGPGTVGTQVEVRAGLEHHGHTVLATQATQQTTLLR